jgi:transposase-like protein
MCASPVGGCTCSARSTTATVDFYLSETRDRDAAKRFLQTALANPDNRPPRVFSVDGNRSYGAAIRELRNEGEFITRCRLPALALSKQSYRIRPSARQAAVASDAGSAHTGNRTQRD